VQQRLACLTRFAAKTVQRRCAGNRLRNEDRNFLIRECSPSSSFSLDRIQQIAGSPLGIPSRAPQQAILIVLGYSTPFRAFDHVLASPILQPNLPRAAQILLGLQHVEAESAGTRCPKVAFGILETGPILCATLVWCQSSGRAEQTIITARDAACLSASAVQVLMHFADEYV
jgi:hypothetical protein